MQFKVAMLQFLTDACTSTQETQLLMI